MKWPTSLSIMRHGESEYNVLRNRKNADPLYRQLIELHRAGDTSELARTVALKVKEKYALGVGDWKTPLTSDGENQAFVTGCALEHRKTPLPDVIIYSPYLRVVQTMAHTIRGWPALADVPQVEDDRIREQEHGLEVVYNDRRVYETLYPEQRELRALAGKYYYKHLQGESVAEVRERIRSMLGTLVREYAEQRVFMFSHHLTILSVRANLERMTPKEFIQLDKKNKPKNCSITTYVGDPKQSSDGKLVLDIYNEKLY